MSVVFPENRPDITGNSSKNGTDLDVEVSNSPDAKDEDLTVPYTQSIITPTASTAEVEKLAAEDLREDGPAQLGSSPGQYVKTQIFNKEIF